MKEWKFKEIEKNIKQVLNEFYKSEVGTKTYKTRIGKGKFVFFMEKKKEYLIALDYYHVTTTSVKPGNILIYDEELSISVGGWETWKETVDIFLDLFKEKHEK